MKIRWSPLALARLAEIALWIAADRPAAAERLVDGLFSAIERLAEFPESGRQVPEFERPELREIIFRSYRVIYRISGDRVDVVTVRHSLQLLDEHELGDESAL